METILVHFIARAPDIPVVMSDAVESRHHPCSMMTPMAMHEDRLVGRIVYDFEEFVDLSNTGPGFVAHANPEELHAGCFDFALLASLAFGLQVDYGLDADGCQVLVILRLRLGTAIKTIANYSEILYLDSGYVRPGPVC